MSDEKNLLSSESLNMLVSSMTRQGTEPLPELAVERFLNALTRLQSNVPTVGGSLVDQRPTGRQ